MKSIRLEKFESFRDHPWLKRLFLKLKQQQLIIARDFILKNDSLDKHDFEKAVNRMFLDKEKPDRWEIILELIANCNV